MSKYTTEIRFIVENLAGLQSSVGGSGVAQTIEAARPKLFDFQYPIYDVAYKPVLETKFIRHFYTREIGEETVGLWKFRLETKLNEIMPYYNQLYESTILKYNPLYDTDYTTDRNATYTGNKNNNGTDNSTRNGSGNSSGTDTTTVDNTTTIGNTTTVDGSNTLTANRWDKYSETPQGGLNGVEAGNYLTNVRNETNNNTTTDKNTTTDNGTTTNKGTNTVASSANYTDKDVTDRTTTNHENYTNTDDFIEHVVGKRGSQSYPQLIKEMRESFINVDEMLFDELECIFMQLW